MVNEDHSQTAVGMPQPITREPDKAVQYHLLNTDKTAAVVVSPALTFSASENRKPQVSDTLESTNTPGVFAVGDCASMVNHPRPKAGVFAVRQVG